MVMNASGCAQRYTSVDGQQSGTFRLNVMVCVEPGNHVGR
jgi:hypothetical protein